MNCEPDAQAVIDAFLEAVLELGEKFMAAFGHVATAIYEAFKPQMEIWDALARQYAYVALPIPQRQIRRRHHIAKLMLRYQRDR